jgi:ketosteroid isomerase-like protein
MDDAERIAAQKTHYRDAYNAADVERVLEILADSFTNMAQGDASFFGREGKAALREQLVALFGRYRVQVVPVIIDVEVRGDWACDYGWHKLALEARDGSGTRQCKLRYYETWERQLDGEWKITFLMTNAEHQPRLLGELPSDFLPLV